MISIRQIFEDDWEIFKDIRLFALQSDPYVFGAKYVDEATQKDTWWRELLREENIAVFILFDQNNSVGMTGIAADRNDPTKQTAYLWGSWIHPDYRGKGLSQELYKARIEWAKKHKIFKRIIVSHRESNISSKRANQKHNFVYIDSKDKMWNDGVSEKEHIYQLIL